MHISMAHNKVHTTIICFLILLTYINNCSLKSLRHISYYSDKLGVSKMLNLLCISTKFDKVQL